ncbi:MAG: glycosyl hydrolase family 98 [Bacteroidales bacterium]|nr:glycosyl hydrolase family 98 [Candidatus Liminaster caballi]
MKKILTILTCLLLAGLCMTEAGAQSRRPIDPQHPAWLIHIDVWNNADPQAIIDLIPDDIKPYVIMNLSMSCSYDKNLDMYQKPQSALQTYRSWASVCCMNNMWFTCQPASGGHTHIQDSDLEACLPTFEQFFIDYDNFLGWNYAEQFWGFDEPGDKSSSTQLDRLALFAALIPMHHKYGGFLTVSFCGNQWSHALNPVGMLKRNADLLQASKDYPEAILWLYKYTTSACWYNNESVTLAPFISGLAKNYGVRYDNCGYNGALGAILGDNHGKKYPAATGIAPVLEQMCLNGACVWDGPELIWTEDFHEIGRTTVNGYQHRNWATFSTFDNIWADMFRKVLDGTIHIASREEVIARTKIALISDKSKVNNATGSGSVGENQLAYATPNDLYDDLYRVSDPMNRNNGYMDNNLTYYKSTGRYQTIPILMPRAHCDSLALTIPTKVTRTQYDANIVWSTKNARIRDFKQKYPEISTGDMFVARHHNELVCYTPYTYLNRNTSSQAEIPLKYNTCESLSLKFPRFGHAIAKEYDDHITFYLNNYRADTTTAKTDQITIKGALTKPTYSYKNRVSTHADVWDEWDEAEGTYTVRVSHNGPLDLTIHCAGSGEDRLTDCLADAPLTDLPKQPEDRLGELIIEAEDMDYKNVKTVVTDAYNSTYRNLRGHSGMGFVLMGTTTGATLADSVTVKYPGTYDITLKYRADDASSACKVQVGSTNKSLTLRKTSNAWETMTFQATLEAGRHFARVIGTGSKDFMVDYLIIAPSEEMVGIAQPNAQPGRDGQYAVRYTTLTGNTVSNPQHGIFLMHMSDGSVRKVMRP